MGMTSANKAVAVVENVRRVLGIELLCACQGIDLRGDFKPGRPLRPVYERVRRDIAFAEKDRAFIKDLEAIERICASDDVLDGVRGVYADLR